VRLVFIPVQFAYADILYGSYNKRQLRAAVNMPITDSKLAFHLPGTLSKRDDYSENIYLNEDADNNKHMPNVITD